MFQAFWGFAGLIAAMFSPSLPRPSRNWSKKWLRFCRTKKEPHRTISGGQNPFSAQFHFQACPRALPLAFSLSFVGCSRRFRGFRASSTVRVQQYMDCTWHNDYMSLLRLALALMGGTSAREWEDRKTEQAFATGQNHIEQRLNDV